MDKEGRSLQLAMIKEILLGKKTFGSKNQHDQKLQLGAWSLMYGQNGESPAASARGSACLRACSVEVLVSESVTMQGSPRCEHWPCF